MQSGMKIIAPECKPADPMADEEDESKKWHNLERAPDANTPLHAAIDYERVEMMQIEAMMRCLCDVLLYSDDDDGAMHADVAKVCARLLNESIHRLEIVLKRVAALLSAPTPDPDPGNAAP